MTAGESFAPKVILHISWEQFFQACLLTSLEKIRINSQQDWQNCVALGQMVMLPFTIGQTWFILTFTNLLEIYIIPNVLNILWIKIYVKLIALALIK